MRLLVLLLIAVLLVTGCGAAPTPTNAPPTPASTATPRQPVSPISPLPTQPTSPLPTAGAVNPPGSATIPKGGTAVPGTEALVQAAKQDLAARLKLQTTDMTVKSVAAVDWPTSALGCPQPGQMYLQVITPGYRIVLTAQGRDYSYHTDRTRVMYCANPS